MYEIGKFVARGTSYLLCFSIMELSEQWIERFEKEGFTNVFEWSDPPGTIYSAHAHQGRVSLFVTDGSITFDFDGVSREILAGNRFDVPVGAPHSAVVGPEGWIVVVGEEIEGDA